MRIPFGRNLIEKLNDLMKEIIKQTDFKEIDSESYITAFKERAFSYLNDDTRKLSAIEDLDASLYTLLDDTLYYQLQPENLDDNRKAILDLLKKQLEVLNGDLFDEKERPLIRDAFKSIYNKGRILNALSNKIAGIDKSPDLPLIKSQIETIDKYTYAEDVFLVISDELDSIK